MTNRLRLSPFLLLAALAAVLTSACAQQVGDIDRTQPNLIPKTQFDGEWYYQRTIVDVPAGAGFTFIGSSDFGGLSVIKFDFQENVLLVRRNIEFITGADDLSERGEDYEGEVIAAFPVQHIDIQRQYNAATGEESNVIVENMSDRPWYERDYVRINWGTNLVHDLSFDFNRVLLEPLAFYPQDEGDLEARPEDAPFFEEDGSYFDLTVRFFARAGMVYIPGYGDAPSCWLFGNEFEECGAGEYAVRHSFMQRDDSRQYVPQPYKGAVTDLFGFFVADRMHYDEYEGIREQDKTRMLTRHNLWVNWYDESTCKTIAPSTNAIEDGWVYLDSSTICQEIPVPERELRPIVYHVNKDFPDDLRAIAQGVADQWNSIFNDVVTAQGYVLEPGERTYILCENNPVQEGDPAVCGEPGLSPRIGDVRFSFMAYIPKYMEYGLLGLGPANNDPITGEIFSGMAYVYHHNNLAAYNTARMLQLLVEPEGSPAFTEFIDGVDLNEWANEMTGRSERASRTFDLQDARHMTSQIANGWMTQYWDGQRREITTEDIRVLREEGFDTWAQPYMQDMYERGILNGEASGAAGRLSQLAGTYIEELLLNDEVMANVGQMPGQRLNIDQNRNGTPDHIEQASVLRGGLGQAALERDRIRQELAAANNMYLPEMADDALMGLANHFVDTDATFEEIYESVRTSIYTAVLAHEVGHSLGLMHNFGGSDDVINYHDEYWDIRDDGLVAPRTIDPITEDEINASIYDYAYSSVMDYAGRYTIDGLGVGKYDRAAMLFGYANLVEVFEDSGGMPSEDLAAWHSNDGNVITGGGTFGLRTIHYTEYYNTMGSLMTDENNRRLVPLSAFEDGFDRVSIDGQTFDRVPYVYCSHSSANLSDHCLTRDAGADSMERMKNIIDDLNSWYILRNFPRGRIGVNTYGYVGRTYGRIYDRMKNWNNLYGLYAALLAEFLTPAQLETFLNDPYEGFGAQTWGVQNAFNYLIQTLLMPDVGLYNSAAPQADGSMLAKSTNGFFAPYNLGITDARYYSTDWSRGDGTERDCGYMWYECLHHIGFYLDKIMAIEALTDSSTNFVARSTPVDIREWEVSFYNTFPEQISAISQAIMSQNFVNVAPTVTPSGKLEFPNYAGALDEPQSLPIDPFATFTVQLYWQVLGQARFPNNYDRSFVQESRIFEVGSGSAPELAEDRLITFTDNHTGLTYGALTFNDRISSGYQMVRRARCLSAISDWDRTAGDPDAEGSPWIECPAYENLSNAERARTNLPSAAAARFELNQYTDLFQIMADMSFMMNYGNPYNP